MTQSDETRAGPTGPGEPVGSAAAEPGFLAELWDAISLRTVGLVLGVLLLQLGFILSYVGAFHAPRPHRIPVATVAPAQISGGLAARLNGIASMPLHATVSPGAAATRRQIMAGTSSGALIVNPAGTATPCWSRPAAARRWSPRSSRSSHRPKRRSTAP